MESSVIWLADRLRGRKTVLKTFKYFSSIVSSFLWSNLQLFRCPIRSNKRNNVVDTDPNPDWIRIQWRPPIRIRIWIHNPYQDPDSQSVAGSRRAKMTHKHRKKLINFIFGSARYSLLRAEGLSCSLDISKLQFLIKNQQYFFLLQFLAIKNPGSGYGSGSGFNESGSTALSKTKDRWNVEQHLNSRQKFRCEPGNCFNVCCRLFHDTKHLGD